MMALSWVVSFSVVIIAVIIASILCGDVTNIGQSNTNAWPQLGNSNRNTPLNAPQRGFNTKSTTPWPALGQRRNQQRDNSFQNEQTNNNRQPMWVRPNNSPNWVRNTPLPNQRANENNAASATAANVQTSGNVRNSSPLGNPINSNTNFLNIERGLADTRPQSGSSQKQNTGNFNQNDRGSFNVNNRMTSAPVKPVGGNQNQGSPSQNKNMGTIGPALPPVEDGGSNNKLSNNNNGISGTISTGSMTSDVEILTQNQNQGANKAGETEDYELREFSEELLSKDTNNVARYVTLNLQGMTTSRSMNDEAPLPLLSIDRTAYSVPSIEKLMLLYNNYILEANENEVYTAQEKIEENNLLDTILSTPVMQHTRNFLIKKGKIGKDPKEFKDLLRLIWFNMYSRGGGRIGSSGFEHVFLAELKNNQVSGLHNWLYFNEEESKNRANYLGYMRKVDLGNKGAVLKYHFTFQGVDKPVGSMFIGTSPELEIALYSTCFVLRADRICPLKMGGNRFIIRTFSYRYRGKTMIGSAFPEI